jgi:alpha-tubulin suppressor-like RCC1 family protein
MESGAVKCWGLASNLAFGDTKLSGNVLTATNVPGIDGSTSAKRALSITTSQYHSCTMMADGSVNCWGYSTKGQTGVGSRTTSPVIPRGLNGASANKRVRSITSSAYHTCVMQASNDVDCWGGTGALAESSQQNPQEFANDPANRGNDG